MPLVKNNSTFRFYCVFTVVEPLVIIMTAVVFDQTDVMTVYWRKDKQIGMYYTQLINFPFGLTTFLLFTDSTTPCWILEETPHLVFFLIPVGITLAFNIAALVWTAIGIKRVKTVEIIPYNIMLTISAPHPKVPLLIYRCFLFLGDKKIQ